MAPKPRPLLLSPSRLTISAAGIGGFVWMTASMGPIFASIEMTGRPIADDGHTATDDLMPMVGVEPLAPPAVIFVALHTSPDGDVRTTAQYVGGPESETTPEPTPTSTPTATAPSPSVEPPQTGASG